MRAQRAEDLLRSVILMAAKRPEDLLSFRHPDGREAAGGRFRSVILMAAKRPEDLLSFRHPDGREAARGPAFVPSS
jgi:hypothetical protein